VQRIEQELGWTILGDSAEDFAALVP